MVIHEIQGPDGRIHEVEAPADASPSDLIAFVEQSAPKYSEDLGRGKSALAGAVSGVPFGADIAGAIGALAYGGGADGSFLDKQRAAKEFFLQKGEQALEQHPGTAIPAMLATGIPAGMAMLPAKMLQAPSVAARAGKGALGAAALGGLYGAGEGQGEGRITNAVEQAVMAAPFGAAGSLAADAVGAGFRATRNLARKAASVFNKTQGAAPNIVIESTSAIDDVQRALQNAPDMNLSDDLIPLTRGQSTQQARLQSLENMAAAGNFGDEAQKMALKAREVQSGAAKVAASKIAGAELAPSTGAETADDLAKMLKQSYAAAKARTGAAYKRVGELTADDPLKIAADYYREGVFGRIKDVAQKGFNSGPYDLGAPGMESAKRLYEQAEKMAANKSITAVNFMNMEHWRGRVSQAIANTKTPTERVFLGKMLEQFDTAMKILPREAIKNGDDVTIRAMEAARTARKTQGILFEKSKFVKDILQNDNLTNEQFYNTLTSLGPRSGSYVRDILRSAPDDVTKGALQQHIKRATMGSIINKSIGSEVIEGSSVTGSFEKMIDFDNLAKNLEKLINNKTYFNQVFDAGERATVERLYRAASLIKSPKPGTKNYSNTAYTLLNVIRQVSPSATATNIAGIGPSSALKAMGEAGAVNELTKSLAPVLKGISDDATGPVTNFVQQYGRKTMIMSPVLNERMTKDTN